MSVSFAQNKIASNQWQKIILKDVSFQLPATIRIPKDKYKEFSNNDKKEKMYDTFEIIAVSTNNAKKASIEIMTTVSENGDYKKLANLNPLSDKDIKSMDNLNQKEMDKHRELYGNIIRYFPIKTEIINGIPFIHFGYKRQLPGNPIEDISVYFAYNNDRTHQMTFKCYAADNSYWKSDLDKIVKSFVITNIR